MDFILLLFLTLYDQLEVGIPIVSKVKYEILQSRTRGMNFSGKERHDQSWVIRCQRVFVQPFAAHFAIRLLISIFM